MYFIKSFLVEKNKRWDKSFEKNKSLIATYIRSFYWALSTSKFILFFSRIGQKTDIKTLLSMRT